MIVVIGRENHPVAAGAGSGLCLGTMRYALRTLAQIRGLRRATGGKLGAEQVAVCKACGFKWSVDIETACQERGDDITGADLVDQANCPTCSGGTAGAAYVVIDTAPASRPVWYPGLFEGRLDTTDAFATAKPRPGKDRR